MTMRATIKNDDTRPNVALKISRLGELQGVARAGASVEAWTWVGAPLLVEEITFEPETEPVK